MPPLCVAIVGCGRISDLHELGYHGREDARIVAVCDARKGRARAKARAWGVGKVYTDYQKLLADPQFVFYPPHVRARQMIEAGEIGAPQMIRLHVSTGKSDTFLNRCTARTVDLPPLVLFRDGKTTPIAAERFEWHDSFIDCTRHLLDVLKGNGQPVLDGPTGKAVLQFTLAAHISAREGREVRPDEVR